MYPRRPCFEMVEFLHVVPKENDPSIQDHIGMLFERYPCYFTGM